MWMKPAVVNDFPQQSGEKFQDISNDNEHESRQEDDSKSDDHTLSKVSEDRLSFISATM